MTFTRGLTDEIGRPTGLLQTPAALSEGLRTLLRPAEMVGGLAGVALALWRPRGGLPVAFAPVVLGLGGFAALGVAGLPLNTRYLLLPAVFLLVLAAHAALGWLSLGASATRRRWAAGAAGLAILTAATVGEEVNRARDFRAGLEARSQSRGDLELLLERNAARLERCPALGTRDRTLAPLLARLSGGDLDDVVVVEAARPARSVVLVAPTGGAAAREFLPADRRVPPRDPGRPGDVGDWRLVAIGC